MNAPFDASSASNEAFIAFRGRQVLVAGAGVTGRSVATALIGMGARVTVTDADAEIGRAHV